MGITTTGIMTTGIMTIVMAMATTRDTMGITVATIMSLEESGTKAEVLDPASLVTWRPAPPYPPGCPDGFFYAGEVTPAPENSTGRGMTATQGPRSQVYR